MENGNDTIDPYPLIPRGATKILCITQATFTKIQKAYRSFFQGIPVRPTKKSLIIRATGGRVPASEEPEPAKERFLTYEPTNAIYLNECDYRRWCRVNEWFAEFGPEAEKSERTILIQ